jgi:predicted GNAT family N-acyltransferase
LGTIKTIAMPDVIVKSSAEFSKLEIGYFIACVRAGGEVSFQGLVERIRNATALVFVKIDGGLVGVAALKRPQVSYRRSVSSRCGIALSAAEFPFELGWVFVSPEARSQGLSLLLAQAALTRSGGAGVFATSRTDNIAMHRSLAKVGFHPTGNPYPSGRAKHLLQAFVRPGAQPGSQQDAAR